VYPVSSSPRGLHIRQQTSARLLELPKCCYLAVEPHRYRLNVVWYRQGYLTFSPSPQREYLTPSIEMLVSSPLVDGYGFLVPILRESLYTSKMFPTCSRFSIYNPNRQTILPFFPLVGLSFLELVSLFATDTVFTLTCPHSFNQHYGPLPFDLSLVGCGSGPLWTGAGAYC
jgi:hypothetical protein